MNYSEMSIYEINMEIAKKQADISIFDDQYLEYGDRDENIIIVLQKGATETTCVDYCNSWADMGPIIEDNDIDIEWPNKSLGIFGTCTIYRKGDTDISIDFKDKSEALRAAAICYLEMK